MLFLDPYLVRMSSAEVTSAYIVVVRTGENTSKETYGARCEAMEELLTSVFKGNIKALTKDCAISDLSVTCEVQLDYDRDCVDLPPYDPTDDRWELTGRAVIEIKAGCKVPLDKSLLSRLIKASPHNCWGANLKIEKRALPADWDGGSPK